MLKLSDVWKINGTPIYAPPADTKGYYESIVGKDTRRTDDGVLHIYWVRRRIYKVELKYPAMTAQELSYMLQLVQGQEYTLTHLDPYGDDIQVSNCYTSNTEFSYYNRFLYGGLYKDVSIDCIEK